MGELTREWMNAGPFHGHDGFMEWMRRWFEAWDDFEFDVQSVEPVGERHEVKRTLDRKRDRPRRREAGGRHMMSAVRRETNLAPLVRDL